MYMYMYTFNVYNYYTTLYAHSRVVFFLPLLYLSLYHRAQSKYNATGKP